MSAPTIEVDSDHSAAREAMPATAPGKVTTETLHEEYVEPKSESFDLVASKEQLKEAVRRVDILIIPIMTVLLSFSYIDRSNMGLAAVVGMSTELEFKGYDYSIMLLVFFPGYALCVLPSGYILSKTSVRYWLPFICINFGLFTLGSGLIRNQAGLLAMRIFMGISEAGCFATVISVVCTWYPRYYVGKRLTIINTGASLIAAFSGVLAYAFSRINIPNYAGWRWIFILEGTITVLVSIAAFFILDEYPETSRFLSENHRDIIVGLIAQDRDEHLEERLTARSIIRTLGDWKIWIFAIMYMLCVVTSYGMAYFIPLILQEKMGFSGALSQLLTTPPYFYAVILAVTLAWLSDRQRMRSPFIAFFALNVIVGMTLTRWGPNTGSQYFGLFLTLGGSLVNGPMIVVFGQNNAPTRTARSVSSGLQLTFGAIGGIIGSTVFRSQDAPTYTPGSIVVICCATTIIILSAIMAWHLHRQNLLNGGAESEDGEQAFVYTI
ncbi:uncharacterized protein N7503_001000 [Penicillium pulvis]|uniref:uncharacterized protein n=1 Tax=Penicillium pulvis TaxID=1562058 RepID=UPI0025468426|nr:uncharacterized protein N7503_001000 [Penicillium pulvis]KAJ5814250.1 hypothetical protein N7503_001000 [Penicillium pulvis]